MATKLSTRKDLETFLSNLDLHVKPSIHVNGKEHPTAVVVVDFGAPLTQVKLTPEQHQELAGKLRKFTKELVVKDTSKDLNVRISSDNYLGLVFWSSTAH
jgi:hypothetical protein